MFCKNSIAGIILAGTIAATGTASIYAVKADDTIRSIPNTGRMEKIEADQRLTIIKSALDGLVKSGTITKAQEDAVLKAMAAKRERIESGKLKQTPDSEKPCKEGKCKHRFKRHGVLNELVNDGTITKEQADAIREAIKLVRGASEKQ